MPTNLNNKSGHERRSLTKKFDNMSEKVSDVVGSPWWFVFSVLIVLLWIPSGFFLGWGELWQLVINTTTTILTFLMMALLHASQNKWERRMEQLQKVEKSNINVIKKETLRMASDINSNNLDEKINSIQQ